MIRRIFLFGAAAGGLGACATYKEPPLDGTQPLVVRADSPPPSKIRSLLIWLPQPRAGQVQVSTGFKPQPQTVLLFNSMAFANELKAQLERRGVLVGIGTSSGFELNRADEQRSLANQLHPTHRLEVDINTFVSRSSMPVQTTEGAIVKWVLFNDQDTKPVRARFVAVSPSRDDSIALADDAVKRLEVEGFL